MPTHYEELRDRNKVIFYLQDLVISQEWSDTYTHSLIKQDIRNWLWLIKIKSVEVSLGRVFFVSFCFSQLVWEAFLAKKVSFGVSSERGYY